MMMNTTEQYTHETYTQTKKQNTSFREQEFKK